MHQLVKGLEAQMQLSNERIETQMHASNTGVGINSNLILKLFIG
jgi:hypothetical protein